MEEEEGGGGGGGGERGEKRVMVEVKEAGESEEERKGVKERGNGYI